MEVGALLDLIISYQPMCQIEYDQETNHQPLLLVVVSY